MSNGWNDLGLVEKVKKVEETMDEFVRPMLAQDGGGIEVIDLAEQDDLVRLAVQYSGACGDCPASAGGTMDFIEETLEGHIGVPFKLDIHSAFDGETGSSW